jgi:hypothetical protein
MIILHSSSTAIEKLTKKNIYSIHSEYINWSFHLTSRCLTKVIMELSQFLAKFLGGYMLIVVAIWLTRKRDLEEGVRNIFLSKGAFPLTGAIHLSVGLLIVIAHPIWKFNWQGLITLLGYASIFQGVARLAFPEAMRNALVSSLEKASWLWIVSLILVGGFLSYHGFSH